jgi:hypothetical protein
MRATTNTTRWARWKATLMGEESLGVHSPEPGSNSTEERRAVWSRLSLVHRGAAGALVLLLLAPKPVHAQFGIDLAAILATLEKMQSMMSSYIAAPLQLIQKEQQSLSDYEHQVMYPVQRIQQAQNSVSQFENQFHRVSGLFHINVSSATLPQSQNLESLLLSRNAANVDSVTGQYQSVYGVVMPQNAASPEVRNMTDMTDAQAQDAMKRAIQIDALSDAELAQADAMGKQIAAAAPGSAPILEAEADAWVVRANAYTQAALAELMRTRGVDIANQSKAVKIGATQNTTTNGLLSTSLSH